MTVRAGGQGRGPRVLVVDDSIVVRQVLALTLRQIPVFTDADIDEAGNGAVALHRLELARYDLVLSDIRMPLMDGLELVRRMRESAHDRHTPVVLISTLGTEEDVRRGMEAGATAYIKKPFHSEEILDVISRLEKKGAA